MPNTKSGGFSLLELLVWLTIISSLTVASQGLTALAQSQQLTATSINIYTLVQISRTHALSRNTRVTLCPLTSAGNCSEQWNTSLSVFADPNGNRKLDNGEQLIRKIDLPSELNLTWNGMGSSSNMHFNCQGQTFVSNGTFTLKIGKFQRYIVINRQGKPKVSN